MASMKTKSGRRMSGPTVKGLAKEAERGFDLAKAKRERVDPGRPSLENGVSPRISYRVARSLYTRAKAKAEAEGRTVSEVAREALQRYVSR